MKDTEIYKILEGIARLEANQSSMKEDISQIKAEDARQNQLLSEHIAGVQSAQARIDIERQARQEAFEFHEKRYEQLEKRLQIVEFVPNLLSSLWKVTKWLGVVAAAVTAITKLLGYW